MGQEGPTKNIKNYIHRKYSLPVKKSSISNKVCFRKYLIKNPQYQQHLIFVKMRPLNFLVWHYNLNCLI